MVSKTEKVFKYTKGICLSCPHNCWRLAGEKSVKEVPEFRDDTMLVGFIQRWVCGADMTFDHLTMGDPDRKVDPWLKWECPKHPDFPDVGERRVVWSKETENYGEDVYIVSVSPGDGLMRVIGKETEERVFTVKHFGGGFSVHTLDGLSLIHI